MLASNICFAQNKSKSDDIRYRIADAVTKNLDKELLGITPKNFTYLYSITLSFNDQGIVDTVYFPKYIAKEVKDVIRLNSGLIKRIKSMNIVYKEYSSKLVLIPFFHYRPGDSGIDYKSDFLKSIESIFPQRDWNTSKKQWVILDTFMSTFTLHVN